MECSVEAFQQRFEAPWLMEGPAGHVQEVFEAQVKRFEPGQRMLLNETNPIVFWGTFLAAVACKATVFLGLNAWSESMLKQAREHMSMEVKANLAGYILIPTGGSGGQLKWAYHTWESLGAAIWGLAVGLRTDRLSTMAALPLGHVSGLMPGLRSWMTGGLYRPLDNKAMDAGIVPEANSDEHWQLSGVPTQLSRWIQHPRLVQWLQSLEYIWIGGAHLPQALAQKACALRIPLAPCYGMTETAAMVLIQKPQDFLAGALCWESPLPHGHLILDGQRTQWCRVGLSFKSLFEGYFPGIPSRQKVFWTQDEIYVNTCYSLSQLRRMDRMIITGGEKVDPQIVEEALLDCAGVSDVFVCAEQHPQWGEQVVAYWSAQPGAHLDEKHLRRFLKTRLSAFQCPKKWIRVAQIPSIKKHKLVYWNV